MTVLNQRLKVRRIGTGVVGDKRFGAVGASPWSPQVLFSHAVVPILAREMGTDEKTARACLYAFGRAAQSMLLRGVPVGIPHLGTVFLSQIVRRFGGGAIAKHSPALVKTKRVVRYVKIRLPDSLRPVISDNASYTGSFDEHLNEARRAIKAYRKRLPKTTPSKATP